MPITFNSEGGFLNGTISSSGNNIFIQTSGSAGIVHLDGDKVLLQSQSAGNKITASLKIEDDNLVINENLRVKRNEFRFKSADRTKEVKIDVSDNGNIRFKDNNDKEIVKFKEGGRIDVGQNDTANSQSITNWNGGISASGFVKCKNTFLGHNIGFPNSFILAHSQRVQSETSDIMAAGQGFAFAQNPGGYTYINAGDGTTNGYESINFYQAGLASSILGKNRNWQFGEGDGTVQFQPPEKLTVEGNISASGNLIIQGSISASSINTTIVSSSIVFSSGSNIFGDASSDTHTFTGHITASGNISATGTGSFDGGMIIPNNTRITFGSVDTFISVDNDNPEDLVIAADDDIFISPDDNLFLQGEDIMLRNTAGSEFARFDMDGVGGLGIGTTTPDEKLEVVGNILTSGNITASGNISSSGDIFADDITAGDLVTAGRVATTGDLTIGGSITTNITASGNISASGTSHTLGGLVKIIAPSDNTSLLRIQDVDNDNNFVFSIDSNQHSDFHIERNSTDKIRFNSYHPAQIDNDAYESHGGLVLGSDVDRGDKSGFGLYVSAGPDSGSIYSAEKVFIGVGGATGSNDMLSVGGNITTTSHITASGNISSSGVGTFNSLDISGNIDVDGTSNLDDTDIDGTINVEGAATFQSRTVFEIGTFTDGDTTPDVRPSTIFKTANTGATTITGFDNGTEGQIIHVVLQDNNTDFTNGTNLILFRGLNYTSGQTNDILSFLCLDGTKWLMLNAQDNS